MCCTASLGFTIYYFAMKAHLNQETYPIHDRWTLQTLKVAALLLPDALFTATSSLECGLSWHWSGVDFSYSTATRSVSVYSSYLLHSLIPLLYNQIMFTSFILFQYKMKMEGEREYNKFWCAISCTGGAVPRLLPADVPSNVATTVINENTFPPSLFFIRANGQ